MTVHAARSGLDASNGAPAFPASPRRLLHDAFHRAQDSSRLARLTEHRLAVAARAWMTAMTVPRVLAIVDALTDAGLDPVLAGGWGVDALLGRRTRIHRDLDVVLPTPGLRDLADVDRRSAAALGAIGYRLSEIKHFPDLPMPIVRLMTDGAGHQIEVLPVDVTRSPFCEFGPPVWGMVGRRAVQCLSPAAQVRLHTGYQVRPEDIADVVALCAHFDLPPVRLTQ